MTQEVIDVEVLSGDGSLELGGDGNTFPITNVSETDPSISSDSGNGNSSYSGNITINANTIYLNQQAPTLYQDVAPSLTSYSQPIGPFYNQEYINVGATPNDGQGDPLRTAFEKINNNFSNLFFVGTSTYTVYSIGDTAGQVIFELPTTSFTQASFQIRSSNPETDDSQGITITSQITNDNSNVRYTGYGTTFEGNAVTRYSMEVLDGNVRLMADPLIDATLLHFVAADVTFIGETVAGLNLQLDGYTDSDMTTESGLDLTTEN
jgi:hypothetical protein